MLFFRWFKHHAVPRRQNSSTFRVPFGGRNVVGVPPEAQLSNTEPRELRVNGKQAFH